MTIAEIAQRANVPIAYAVRELSRIMGTKLTAQSTVSSDTATYAIFILAIDKVL